MFCQECGQMLETSMKFCPNCGLVLDSAARPQTPQPALQSVSRRKPVIISIVVAALLVLSWAFSKTAPSPSNRSASPGVQSNITGGNPPQVNNSKDFQGNSAGGNPPRVNSSNQELARAYVSFIQEENQIIGAWNGPEIAQLTQKSLMNPTQQNLAAVSNFYRMHLQQVQYLNSKLDAFQQADLDVKRFQQAQRTYLAAVAQLDQILISNPNPNSKALWDNLKAKGQEADEAALRLAARLGIQ